MPTPKGPPPTLPEAATDFLRDSCQNARTESAYRTALVSLQAFAEDREIIRPKSPLPTRSLYPELLADYYSWLREHSYRNATIRLYLSAATQYLLWLEAGHQLPDSVLVAEMHALLERKTGRRGRRIRPDRRGSDPAIGTLLHYYADELASLPSEGPRARQRRLILLRNHALLLTLYATAGRAAEVASLQRADVAQGKATQVEIVGKGNKRRTLILTAPAQAAIAAYLRERTDSAPGLFVSHGTHKEQPLTTQTIWQIVNAAAKAVFGTDRQGHPRKRVGPHAFRHLRAQDLSDEGMPITSLQALLGHASIETTRNTYAPKTQVDQLIEEVATYGRSPEEVAERGRKSLAPE